MKGIKIEHRQMPSSRFDVSIYKDERDGYKYTADSLNVFLYPFKAVLYQIKPESFRAKDLRLREGVLQHYSIPEDSTIKAIRGSPMIQL